MTVDKRNIFLYAKAQRKTNINMCIQSAMEPIQNETSGLYLQSV